MYEQIFQLNSRPFTATPYVNHYFAGNAIHQSLGQATACIDRGLGPVVVVGATGTGKSLLLAMLESQYQSKYHVVNLGCARLDERRELLQSVLHELQLPFKDLSETELRFSLIDYLKPSEKCPNGVLLLIDEAHSLSCDLLDEIRLILNFVRDGEPRIRLVIAGSQRLEENLTDPSLESLAQRIAARCYLENLNREETARYITEHIERAGGECAQVFDRDSLKSIHRVSDGCPRLINQVCDQALLLTATRGQNVVTSNCIDEAWSAVQSIPNSFAPGTSASPSQSNEPRDDKWTVIEFGQLEDDEDEAEKSVDCETRRNAETSRGDLEGTVSKDWENGESTLPALEPSGDSNQQEFPAIDADLTDAELRLEDADIPDLELEQSQILDLVSSEKKEIFCEKETAFKLEPADLEEELEELTSLGESCSHEFEQPVDQQEPVDPGKSEGVCSTELADNNRIVMEVPDSTQAVDLRGETDNPFDEVFEEEENLIDRYAPFVAHQNQSSLSLTSEDLALLVPADEMEDSESAAAAIVAGAEELANVNQAHLSLVKDEHGKDGEETDDISNQLVEPEQVDVVESEYDGVLSTTDTEPLDDLQTPASSPEEVRFQAEQVLKGLNQTAGVSCETSSVDLDVEEAITVDVPGDQRAADSQNKPHVPHVAIVDSDYEQQNAALDESQQILNEILEQKHAIAKDRILSSGENSEYPEDGNELPKPAIDSVKDDGPNPDMIILNRMEEPSEKQIRADEESIQFPKTPISTGRAERMDYQKLFTQLRDVPVQDD